MFTLLLVIFQVCSTHFINAEEEATIKSWPSDLKRCSINDQDLNACLLDAAKQVMPVLIRGYKELGLVSLDPMSMGNFTLGAEKGPITLKVDLAAALLSGQSKMKIESIKYDRDRYRLEMEGLHREVELSGDYRTEGRLFRVPINSKGTLLFTLKNMQASHIVQFKPKKERGLTFMDLEILFKINHIDLFKMDLYNPKTTRFAGYALNKLMNDNWRAIFAAFTPSMEGVVQKVYTEAFKPMFQNIPYEEILPQYQLSEEN